MSDDGLHALGGLTALTVILGPPELVRLAYVDLVEMLWTRLGLVSQPRKCNVYSPEGDVSAFPPSMAGARRWQSSRRRGPWGAHWL